MNTLTVTKYTPKSIVVRGKDADATRSRKEDLKKLGGRFNPRLRARSGNGREAGWVFSLKDQDKVREYVNRVNYEIDNIPKLELSHSDVSKLNQELRQRRRQSLPLTMLADIPEVRVYPTLFDEQCGGEIIVSQDTAAPPLPSTGKRFASEWNNKEEASPRKRRKVSYVNIEKPFRSDRRHPWWATLVYSLVLTTTFFVFLATPTGTGIVATDLGSLSYDWPLTASYTDPQNIQDLMGNFRCNLTWFGDMFR